MVNAVAFKDPQARIAVFRVAALLLTTLCAVFCWVVLRMPVVGVTNAVGPLLVTGSALAASTPEARRRNLFLCMLLVSVIQFVRGWLSYDDALSLAAVVVMSLLVHKFVRSAAVAGGAMMGGLLDTAPMDFSACANAAVTLWLTGLMTAWGYVLLEKYLPIPDDRPIFPAAPALDNAAIVRRTLIFGLAYYLVEATDWEESFWIMLSVGGACAGGLTGRKLREMALLRLLWTPAGLALSICFMQGLVGFDFRFNYLMLLIGIGCFYALYRYDNFPVYYILFVLVITTVDAMTNGHHKFGNPMNYFFQVNACVLLATACIFLIERDGDTAHSPQTQA